MEFETTDIVTIKAGGILFHVTGVIHDDERLFLTGNVGAEFEVAFSDIAERWARKEL